MKETAKSLGEFVASVLSTISGATYIPAAVMVGGAWLACLFATAGDESPARAVISAPTPTFAQLAVFVVVVMVVASVLEPVQFWLTRLAEGHLPIPLVGGTLLGRKLKRYDELDNQRSDAATQKPQVGPEGIPLRPEYFADLDGIVRSASAKLRSWPDRDRVVATRLGNLIRHYEDAANEALEPHREALPGNGEIQDLLPFAYFAIPETTRHQHAYFRSQLQCMVAMMLTMPLLALTLAVTVGSMFWALGVIVAGSVVTATCASGARSAGDGYGTVLLAIARQYAAGSVDTAPPKMLVLPSTAQAEVLIP